MTDRPIIFSAPMVRALIDGRKTQTRRLAASPLRRVEVGDRLYVRETWRTETSAIHDEMRPLDFLSPETRAALGLRPVKILYDADAERRLNKSVGKTRVAIHMPRWASRLTLIVEDVRVQRLDEISAADACAEGVELLGAYEWRDYSNAADAQRDPIASFRTLWESLHGAGSWSANPWIVALTVRVVRENIDRIIVI